MDDRLEENKRNVTSFCDLMFISCKPAEAVEKYVGDAYFQHNPGVADGEEAFIAYFYWMAREYPGKRVEFKRVIAEGNYVACTVFSSGREIEIGLGSIFFRLDERGKIIEHWDVLQVVPETSANTNTIF